MIRKNKAFLAACIAVLALTGCVASRSPTASDGEASITQPAPRIDEAEGYPLSTPLSVPDRPYPAPLNTSPAMAYPAPEDEGPTTGPIDCEALPAGPQEIHIDSSDGTRLAATYYPAKVCGAPLVLLMHQMGDRKESWQDLARWLQNRPEETSFRPAGKLAAPLRQYAWFPPMPEDLSLAVLAFDFRGHGGSEGSGGLDRPGFLLDAQAALHFARSLPEIDGDRILTMGASIGADAAVDICISLSGTEVAAEQIGQGCIGAISFSPGGFLGVSYADAVTALGSPPHKVFVHCFAAAEDGNSPELCRGQQGRHKTETIYPGRDHGIRLLQPERAPDIGETILEFLLNVLADQ